MKIAVVLNNKISDTNVVVQELKLVFDNAKIHYDLINIDNMKSGYDFVFAIGGDGTMLRVTRFYAKYSTPVMGVNMGRLGFLSLIAPKDIRDLAEIMEKNDYEIQERIMLKSGNDLALNDIVIKGHSPNRMAKFNLYINDKFVSDYIADGLIIATPTGSTAYGLSAGGPILYPELDCLTVVPICPHSMTARPLVIPSSEKIIVRSADECIDYSCDGQDIKQRVKSVKIELADYKAKLAFPKGDNFYSILRNKLHWGISPVSTENIV